MTTPAYPNPISLYDVGVEFGVYNLGQAFAGAGYVPSGTVGYPYGSSTPIPSGGTISLANFWGATKITPPPPSFAFVRFQALTDRISVFRFPMTTPSGLGVASATSSPTGLSWVQIYWLLTSTNVQSATVSLSIENQIRGSTSVSISHQPTPSEPFVDVRIDDDAQAGQNYHQILLTVQLGAGQIAPGAYNGNLYNDGGTGTPRDQNQLPTSCYSYPGYPNGVGGYLPRIWNGNTEAQPPFTPFYDADPYHCTDPGGGGGGTG